MAISHVSKVYAVTDAKISKLTADPAGGSATYATAVDVPGIKSVTIGGDINNVELRGDNGLLDSNSKLQNVTVSWNYGKVSLDALVVMLGGAATDAGSGSTETATYALLGTDTFNYFKFEAATPNNGADSIGGDIHFVLYKCVVSEFPELGMAEEDYQVISASAKCTPRLADQKLLDVVFNETAASIS